MHRVRNPALETDALWTRLKDFTFDPPGAALPFVARLARENHWAIAHAGRVVLEYKRFLFLAMRAGHPVSPSSAVDQAWHMHLLYTRSYWEHLCGEVLGRPLHHEPTLGGRAQGEKFKVGYEKTLRSYQEHFGEPPPADLWPDPERKSRESTHARWVDPTRNWIIPKPFAGRHSPRARMGLLALVLLILCLAPSVAHAATGPLQVLDMKGPEFLGLYAVLYAAAFGWTHWKRHLSRTSMETTAYDRTEIPTDPLSIAYLSGGRRRTVLTAMGMLMSGGWATYDAKQTAGRPNGWRVDPCMAPPTHPVLLAMWNRMRAATTTQGLRNEELYPLLAEYATPVEVDVAERGLRPTGLEATAYWRIGRVPFIALMTLGTVKVLVGASRGKPVVFLILFLLVTGITLALFAVKRPLLTGKGRSLLARLKAGNPLHTKAQKTAESSEEAEPHGKSTDMTLLALYGRAMVLTVPSLLCLRPLARAEQGVAPGTSSSGCSTTGCGSGCGSSGCGGGGCGGCGGGD